MNYRMVGVEPNADFDEEVIVATHQAQPGTYLVYAYKDGSWSKVPVLLWGVQQNASPVPITMTGVWDGVTNRNSFVQHPDGMCSAYEREWGTLDEALKDMRVFDT